MTETKKTILALDDDETFRILIRQRLENAGYNVHSVETGVEAIACFQDSQFGKNGFDLIILDLLMPRPNGFEVFWHLKELSVTSGTPVLILTVIGLEPQVQDMLEAGAHHVKKDEANTQLLPKIRELLGESP
ncbi:MAG TPA: response regulator [Pyrinomonadaceae bacterium]|jgi:CheY-like chemotaxis protein